MKLDFCSKIQKQWDSKLPFVLFSLPHQSHTTAFLQNEDRLNHDALLQKKGFVIGSFDSKAIYTIESDQVLTVNEFNCSEALMEFSIFDQGDRHKHIQSVQKAVNFIKNSSLEKVVLAREIKAYIKANPLNIYSKLNKTYPKAFTYCFYHPQIGLWIGASPELLVSVADKEFKTVSLAGTRWADLSTQWESKELEEQQLVTRYIELQLRGLDLTFDCSDVETIQAGNLLHLKQEFTGQLNESQLIDLIKALHPTPAVCGLPANLAQQYLKENEDLDRGFYAGFMGPVQQIDSRGEVYSYLGVNIRSMKIDRHTASLYVGGGITADSKPELEWEETVKKSMTLSSIFE